MTREEREILDECDKWCEVFGLPPITLDEIKEHRENIRNSWAFAYTSKGIEYFPGHNLDTYVADGIEESNNLYKV